MGDASGDNMGGAEDARSPTVANLSIRLLVALRSAPGERSDERAVQEDESELDGLALRRVLALTATVRRHHQWVTRIGGLLLITIGLALLTGGWTTFINWLRATVGPDQIASSTAAANC